MLKVIVAPTYRIPLVIALVLHGCLIVFSFVQLPTTSYRLPGPVAKVTPVRAITVDAKQVEAQIATIRRRQARRKAQQQARVHRLQMKARAAHQARLVEQRRVAQLKKQRAMLSKQRATEAAKLKKLRQRERRALTIKQQQLQKKWLSQQMAVEQQQLEQVAKKANAQQQQGVVNRYKAAILQAIGRRWLVPQDADKRLSSVYLIQLAPGGVVLSVMLVHSSGNAVLDRSARVAILKASPLPVPKDPALFDNFRQLRLTVSPKTVVKSEVESDTS